MQAAIKRKLVYTPVHHQLMRMAHAGGGFRLDAFYRYPDELMQISTAAKTGGATATFSDMARHSSLLGSCTAPAPLRQSARGTNENRRVEYALVPRRC